MSLLFIDSAITFLSFQLLSQKTRDCAVERQGLYLVSCFWEFQSSRSGQNLRALGCFTVRGIREGSIRRHAGTAFPVTHAACEGENVPPQELTDL